MRQFWVTFFGSIAGVFVGAILMAVFLIFLIGGLISSAVQSADSAAAPLPGRAMVLELDLRTPRTDQPSASPFAFANPLSITELVTTLTRAQSDGRVSGVFVRANEFGLPPGQAEEIRAALGRFSQSGKFVIAHAQGFEGTAVSNYFAVGGVDSLWLQDTSSFSAVGLASETLFLGGLFEQFDAQPEFVQFYEYKNAADVYTQSDYTEAHREATLSWLGSLFDTAMAGLAADRGLDQTDLTRIITSGPYSAEQALEAGLVDALGHVAEARAAALARAGNGARFVELQTYARTPAGLGSGPVIALVGGQGPIVTGDPEVGFGGQDMIGGDPLSDAIDAAAGDDAVRAIVLRVDSPGGSAIASDQIWDAVLRARQAGKPVVVSMGTLAASGGYYIAAPADLIVANASTLTGSIGMLGGKVVLDGALQRLGLNLEPLSVGGEYTLAFSTATPWTDTQRAAYQRLSEDIYEDFTERVAEGRDLPLSRVQDIARGRVWTGAQAAERGLVDRIGGLHEAVDAARELAGIGADETVQLRRYPAPPTPLEAFQELFGISADSAEAAAQLNALLSLPEVQAALQARHQAQTGGRLYEPAAVPN